jgi:hypothetical protein
MIGSSLINIAHCWVPNTGIMYVAGYFPGLLGFAAGMYFEWSDDQGATSMLIPGSTTNYRSLIAPYSPPLLAVITGTVAYPEQPTIEVLPSGIIFVFWGDNGAIVRYHSLDDGATWAAIT